jgi:hypothetical protein
MKTNLLNGPHSCVRFPLCVVYRDRLAHSSTIYTVFQSTFFDGSNILLMHDPPWLVDRFFLETAAMPRGMLARLAGQLSETDSDSSTSTSSCDSWKNQRRDSGNPPPNRSLAILDNTVDLFEKGLAKVRLLFRQPTFFLLTNTCRSKLLVDYFTSFYHNRARQRRKLAASLLDWHLAFEHASDLSTSLSTTSSVDVGSDVTITVFVLTFGTSTCTVRLVTNAVMHPTYPTLGHNRNSLLRI